MNDRQIPFENVTGSQFDEANVSSKHLEALKSRTMGVNQNKWMEDNGYFSSQNYRRVSARKDRDKVTTKGMHNFKINFG